MSGKTVAERVVGCVKKVFGDFHEATRESNFIDDFGADSLDLVELAMEIEDEFDIEITDEEAEKIKTVGQAIKYIERLRPWPTH